MNHNILNHTVGIENDIQVTGNKIRYRKLYGLSIIKYNLSQFQGFGILMLRGFRLFEGQETFYLHQVFYL